MDIESMARYWSQDAENYGDIIRKELASFRVDLLRRKCTQLLRVLPTGGFESSFLPDTYASR